MKTSKGTVTCALNSEKAELLLLATKMKTDTLLRLACDACKVSSYSYCRIRATAGNDKCRSKDCNEAQDLHDIPGKAL